jgi:TM2 domain-containing membrane protein YozV
MAKIDKMLEMITERGVERAVLIGDRPFQLWTGGRKVEGAPTPAASLHEVMQEIVPPQFEPLLRDGGAFHFRHVSPHGLWDIGAENFVGSLQVTITPARAEAGFGSHSPHPARSEDLFAPAERVAQAPFGSPGPFATPQPAPGTPAHSTPATLPNPFATVPLTDAPAPSSIVPAPFAPPPVVAPPNNLAAAAPVVVSAAALSQSGIVCSLHAERTAAGVCAHSGKFYCADCLVQIDGRQYGEENLSQLFAQARQSSQHGLGGVHAGGPAVVINNSSNAVAQPVFQQPTAYAPPVPAPHYGPGPVVRTMSPKSRVLAGLLGIFFGGLGVHRFYLGNTGIGFLQILATLVTLGWGGLWGFVEGILLLCGVMDTDSEGRTLQA